MGQVRGPESRPSDPRRLQAHARQPHRAETRLAAPGDISPEVVADFRAKLEAAGVGRHSVRQSLVVLQSMFEQAIRWGWLPTNRVKSAKKPGARRERAVVCLAPSQVEAIRQVLLAGGKLYPATMVSLIAY